MGRTDMTPKQNLIEAAEQALEVWDGILGFAENRRRIDIFRTALAAAKQEQQAEPMKGLALNPSLIGQQYYEVEVGQQEQPAGWLEAAVAWEVCGSLHQAYCKGKDPFFKMRQDDFAERAADARAKHATLASAPSPVAGYVPMTLNDWDKVVGTDGILRNTPYTTFEKVERAVLERIQNARKDN